MDQTKTVINSDHLFKPGQSGNPNGRPPMTEPQKIVQKAQRDLIKEYKANLMSALPLISPVLIAKAMEGDIVAIKEVNDRVMGKSIQVSHNENINIDVKMTTEELERLDNLLK